MDLKGAVKTRISRRKYTGEPIEDKLLKKIEDDIDEINNVSGLSIEMVSDAGVAFSSMKKSYGMFSGVKSCIVFKGPESDSDLKEKIGYYGEELTLRLTSYGLGTCFVAGTFEREHFSIPDGEKMCCVMPFGYTEGQSVKERVVRGAISVRRKPARDRMTGYEAAPAWAKDAMEAVVLAPSAVNSQRPMFHYADGKITADVQDDGAVNLVDLGIAKKNFEIYAGGKFQIGNGAEFIKDN